MILTVFLCLLSYREATTDDSDRFSVSVFTRESVVLMDTHRRATTDDSDPFFVSVFTRESVLLTDTRREATMVSCPSGLFVWSSDRDSGPVCNRLADVKDPVAAEQQILFFFTRIFILFMMIESYWLAS